MDTNSNNNRREAGSAGSQRLPQQVYYQRRRAAAVVILVVLVLLLVWILSSLGGGSEEDNSAQVAETSTQQPVETETSAAESEAPAPAPASASEEAPTSEAAPSEEAPKDSCTLADLVIEARTDQPNYGESVLPTFYMTVKNPTAADCVIDFSESIPRFEVYNLANNERMWADVDCNESVSEAEETIAPGSERFFQATWSRTTSAPDQCDDRQPVEPGSFYLHTVIGDNASQPATFNLR